MSQQRLNPRPPPQLAFAGALFVGFCMFFLGSLFGFILGLLF